MRPHPSLLLWLCLTAGPALAQDDDPRDRRRMSPAVPSASFTGDGRPDRKDFDFGRSVGRAWLAAGGELKIDSWVQHSGLLCATYETGIRFGRGEHGCTGVQWLAPTHWLTRVRQCNNALMQHTGADTDDHMASVFDQVTCAERLLRCEGNCR